jgi:hypothetical protein
MGEIGIAIWKGLKERTEGANEMWMRSLLYVITLLAWCLASVEVWWLLSGWDHLPSVSLILALLVGGSIGILHSYSFLDLYEIPWPD